MGVDGYLEIYTTLYGWQFYNFLWVILAQTGIIYLPVLGVLINNWKEPAESQDDKPAASTSLRRNIIDLSLMAIVFVLAVVPVYTLSPEMISYTNQCTNIDVKGGSTGTTYDNQMYHFVKMAAILKRQFGGRWSCMLALASVLICAVKHPV